MERAPGLGELRGAGRLERAALAWGAQGWELWGAVRQEGALGDLGVGLLMETAGMLCGGHRHSQRRR